MKILVIGGGGREAVICRKLKESPRVSALFCAPGNAGIAAYATLVPLAATDLDGICAYVEKEAFDMVVVAPDDPLALGLVDRLEAMGVRVFGPSRSAARIESSKAFAKELMRKRGIPTAAYALFDDYAQAAHYIESAPIPTVIKADGLALGKGVFVCHSRPEAQQALKSLMQDNAFGQAGAQVLVEEFLSGPELTVMAFTDGKSYRLLPNSRDHKRAYDGDLGPNTGGMGVISPGAVFTEQQQAELDERIFKPTLDQMAEEGYPFKGVIYFGLMLTEAGPKVIEYNARFGDPEAETVLPLLKTELLDIFEAVIDEKLAELPIHWSDEASCCVVLASEGYPGSYPKGLPIQGIEEAESGGAMVFHAGTKWSDTQQCFVTAGGRVLAVVAQGESIAAAQRKTYAAVDHIEFKGMQYRRDIGGKN